MALSLEQIRSFVRGHLDLDTDDLPDVVLDVFIREGSKRVEKAAARWPFYETTWSLDTVAGQRSYAFTSIGADIDQISSIQRDDAVMRWIGPDLYNVRNPLDSTSQSKPCEYAIWASTLYLTPTPDATYTLTIRGYRQPNDWVAEGAGGEPDLPDELHNTVATWALSKAYVQQEDPELGSYYERQFVDELNEYKRRIVETPHPQPLVLGGESMGSNMPFGRLRYSWE